MKRLAWFAVLLGSVLAAFAAGTRFASRETVRAQSPAGGRTAWVTARRCFSGPCEALWIGGSAGSATKVATLDGDARVTEIAWTKDGARLAFLIDGTTLRFYDASTLAPAGVLTVVISSQSGPTPFVVRGVTFSDNGRAITFDECPRGRAGCRAGFAAVPR